MIKRVIITIILLSVIPYFAAAEEKKGLVSRVVKGAFSVAESIVPGPEKVFDVYGSVASINPAQDSLKLYYYDQEKDAENTIELLITDNTDLENAGDIRDIKKGNLLSVKYVVLRKKNVARLIVVEKEKNGNGSLNAYFDFEPEDAEKRYHK